MVCILKSFLNVKVQVLIFSTFISLSLSLVSLYTNSQSVIELRVNKVNPTTLDGIQYGVSTEACSDGAVLGRKLTGRRAAEEPGGGETRGVAESGES